MTKTRLQVSMCDHRCSKPVAHRTGRHSFVAVQTLSGFVATTHAAIERCQYTCAKSQLQEAVEALFEAITFLSRGLKLLSSDVSNSGRRFWRAALGKS